MFNDSSYKLAFIYAFFVHILIILLLVVKYHDQAKPYVLEKANIIHAVVINGPNLDKQRLEIKAPPELPQAQNFKQQVEPKIPEKLESQEKLLPEKEVQKKLIPLEDKAKVKAKKREEAWRNAKAALRKRLLEEELAEVKSIKNKIKKAKAATASAKRQQLLEQLTQKQLAYERQELSAASAAQSAQFIGEVNKYKAMLIQAISAQWIVPEGVEKGATCILLVEMAPGGMVLKVKLIKSSGNELLDRSAQKAVLKASPLPVPEDPAMFDEFRSLKLTVRPEGIL